MWNTIEHSPRWPLAVVVGATLLCMPPPPATAASPLQQAIAVADLTHQIAACLLPPCIGTDEEEFRALVRGQVVTDLADFYTDLATAYPGFAHRLQGVVMWDLESTVDGMLFIFTDFHAAPAVVIAELERELFECEEEDAPEEGQQEWYCLRSTEEGNGIEADLYISNGVLLIEVEEE